MGYFNSKIGNYTMNKIVNLLFKENKNATSGDIVNLIQDTVIDRESKVYNHFCQIWLRGKIGEDLTIDEILNLEKQENPFLKTLLHNTTINEKVILIIIHRMSQEKKSYSYLEKIYRKYTTLGAKKLKNEIHKRSDLIGPVSKK